MIQKNLASTKNKMKNAYKKANIVNLLAGANNVNQNNEEDDEEEKE